MNNGDSLKCVSSRSLRKLETVAEREGWNQIQQMVRDERQVRMGPDAYLG